MGRKTCLVGFFMLKKPYMHLVLMHVFNSEKIQFAIEELGMTPFTALQFMCTGKIGCLILPDH